MGRRVKEAIWPTTFGTSPLSRTNAHERSTSSQVAQKPSTRTRKATQYKNCQDRSDCTQHPKVKLPMYRAESSANSGNDSGNRERLNTVPLIGSVDDKKCRLMAL
jgi:hypothetical protein